MKLKKTYKNNSGKINIIMFILFCVLTLGLTVGYSSLNKELKISAEAVFRKQEAIRITNLELSEIQNEGLENYKSKYSKNTISVGVDLKNIASTVKYKVTVSNTGSVAMWIESITEELKNNNYMVYELDGINIKDLIKPGEQRDFYVIFKYKSDINELPQNTTLDEMLRFKFVKPDSVLAKGSSDDATKTFWNGTKIKKEEVEEITFSPTLEPGEESLGFWDASDKEDGTVIAWYKDSDGDNLYELTVGGIGVVYANPTSSNLFSYFSNLKKIEFNNYFNTSKVTVMSSMFRDCKNLISLDLSMFDTSKVTSMRFMFSGCESLTSLNISDFNTSKTNEMSYMFQNCKSLTSLDVSGFDTSKVTNMYSMFNGCSSLISLDVSGFKTSNVNNMNAMFQNCKNLALLDVSNFKTLSVTTMQHMFSGCESLTNLDVSGFDTSSVNNMSYMFRNCKSLTLLDVSNFKTSGVTNMSYMFSGCESLTSLDVSNFDTKNVTDMQRMFGNCSGLTSLNLNGLNTSSVTNMSGMFVACSGLANLNLNGLNTSSVTNMTTMFYGCSNLTSLDVSSFVTSSVTDMSYMFRDCSNLTSLDLSNFDTSSVTNMINMFDSCSSLTELDISGFSFNLDSEEKVASMFSNCNNLKTVKVTDEKFMEILNKALGKFNCEKENISEKYTCTR